MTLNLAALGETAQTVRRLIIIGAPLGWFFGAVAAHYIAGLSPAVAILFGGLLVVTGPTVIAPMLRQARLSNRPAAVLRWEGIVNDPVGALFAVLTYEIAVHWVLDQPLIVVAGGLLLGISVALGLGVAAGVGCIHAFHRGYVPEFLKAPLMLGAILLCFAVSNLVYDEAGLLAVTALGMTVGNSRIASLDELRRFKEYVSTALVSSVFVVLTATLTWDAITALDWRHAAFIGAMLFLVRPAAVILSTIGTPLPWKERALVAWIAPRGIVAVAVAGLFATKLQQVGFEDGALLVPLAFAIVFVTVIVHGFSIGWLAKVMGLVSTRLPGILIVGASRWTVGLASVLKDLEVPTLIADGDWKRLKLARQQKVPTYFGEVLSEVTEHRLEFNAFGHLVAATPNDAYNALVCTDLAPELGRANVYQTGYHESSDHPHRRSFTLGGRTLLRSGIDTDDMERRMTAGWTFQKTRLTDAFTMDDFLSNRPADAEILLILKADGRIVFATHKEHPKGAEGDVILSFVPPESRKMTGEAAAASIANSESATKRRVP